MALKLLQLALWCCLVVLLAACVAMPAALPAAPATPATVALATVMSPTVMLPTVTPNVLSSPVPSTPMPTHRLLLTNSMGHHITRLDPATGAYEQLEVGAAPWGIVLNSAATTAYVATAEGVAVVDLAAWQRTALVPYTTSMGTPRFGEYRPGGMGIAIAPDDSEVYVGVYPGDGSSRMEILDTAQLTITESYPVGLRPFQLLTSADGAQIYSIDHDAFTVTVLDVAARTVQTLPATPLGGTSLASFDKPHYAVLDGRGHLLLPYQGQVLLDLDPLTGEATTRPLNANTHQHGIAWTPDQRTLLIVGTGPAGGATDAASLTLYDWASGREEFIPLTRAHEHVAASPDGRWAYITGGHTFANGGWDGVTVVDLTSKTLSELPVPDRPLDIVVLP